MSSFWKIGLIGIIGLIMGQMTVFAVPATYCPFFSQDVVRLRASSMSQLQKLKFLMENYRNLHIKPWVQPSGADTPSLYMAPRDVVEYLVAQTTEWGMEATVVLQDVQRSMLDIPTTYNRPYKYAYVSPTVNRTPFNRSAGPETFRQNEFHPLSEINWYLESLVARYPNLCQMESIGKSYEGRDINMLRIGTNPNSDRGIFLDATMHAREWLATSTSLYVASQLLTQYQKNAEIRALVDNITWYVVPVVNVDGYDYTWTTDRNWRRSRSKPDPCTGAQCHCRGVDLNRNWDSHWNTTDACWHPCCNTFPGTKAMSEPEVRNLAKKLKSLENKVQAYVSLHAYGQFWMYSYGHKNGEFPKDVDDLHKVAELGVEAVKSVHGTQYKAGPVASSLYEYSGGSQDWVKDHTNIKYSYLIELRPPGFSGEHAGHFCVDFNQILPTGQEIFEGLKVVAKAVQGQLDLKKLRRSDQINGAGSVSRENIDFQIWIFSSVFYMFLQRFQ